MIQSLEIQEGDLNFFVGEHGTGKSLVLQLIKLLKDKNHIRKTLEQYGFTWRNKEFFPLLLSLYWLCPPSRVPTKEKIITVIIEEPEMVLYPSAIHAVFVQILELLSRGYKVYVSTHSANFLEYLWAVKHIRKAKKVTTKEAAFAKLTKLPKGQLKTKEIFATIKKDFKVYYFHKGNSVVQVKDISELDVSQEDASIFEWGSLLSLSQRVSEIVSELAE